MKNQTIFKPVIMAIFALSTLTLTAQDYSGDAFKYSQQVNPAGSARMRAMGGNHAAIGADASNITGNPAGLGMYNRTEFSFGTELTSLNTNADYINTKTGLNSTNVGLNNFSMIFGKGNSNVYSRSGWKASTFAIGYNRNSNLFNKFNFTGLNNASSLADSYVQAANSDPTYTGAYLDASEQFDAATRTAFIPEAMYYQAYLIEPSTQAGPPYNRFDFASPTATRQTGVFSSEGKTSQWTFATGTSYKDKLYLGVSGGISRMNYDFTNEHTDTFTGGKYIDSFTSNQYLAVDGRGMNISAGIIYRPNNVVRFGAELHSPTWYTISETFDQNISVDVNQNNTANIPKDLGDVNMASQDFDFELRTPARASAGMALFFDKKGFVTADVEYVGYSGMKLSANTLSAQDNIDFTNNNRDYIKQDFNNVLNIRLGAELRAGAAHFRAGAAYLPDPYKVRYDNIDRSKLQLSAGVGARTDKFFVDLSGQYLTYKQAFTPYTLTNNTEYASVLIDNKAANFTVSIGAFFR